MSKDLSVFVHPKGAKNFFFFATVEEKTNWGENELLSSVKPIPC